MSDHGSRWRGKRPQPPPTRIQPTQMPGDQDASNEPKAVLSPRPSNSAQEAPTVEPAEDPQERRNQKAQASADSPPRRMDSDDDWWRVDIDPSPTTTPSGQKVDVGITNYVDETAEQQIISWHAGPTTAAAAERWALIGVAYVMREKKIRH